MEALLNRHFTHKLSEAVAHKLDKLNKEDNMDKVDKVDKVVKVGRLGKVDKKDEDRVDKRDVENVNRVNREDDGDKKDKVGRVEPRGRRRLINLQDFFIPAREWVRGESLHSPIEMFLRGASHGWSNHCLEKILQQLLTFSKTYLKLTKLVS